MDRGYAKRKLLKKDTQKAAVFGAVLICAAAFTAALTGCVSTQAETEKIRDMKYEVIEEEDIPQSLREMIKGGEKKPFRITYSDQGFLYKNDSDRSEKRGGKRKSRNIPLYSRADGRCKKRCFV